MRTLMNGLVNRKCTHPQHRRLALLGSEGASLHELAARPAAPERQEGRVPGPHGSGEARARAAEAPPGPDVVDGFSFYTLGKVL